MHPLVHRTLLAAAGLVLALLLGATAEAVAAMASAGAAPDRAGLAVGPRLSATPNPASFGRPVAIAGHGWPVIEFCERRVRLSLRSPQNVVALGAARVGRRGGFRRSWTPRRSEIGAGRWRLVARMRCESGRDGSAVPVVRSLTLRIR